MKTFGLKIAGIILLGILFTYGSAIGAKHLERTFHVGPGGSLTLDSDLGSVQVEGQERNTVQVTVDSKHEIEEILDLNFTQEGNEVIIKGEKKRVSLFKIIKSSSKKVHFTISVPRSFNVNINTSGGGIDLRSIEGEVRGATSGGKIIAEEITGRLDARTSGGKIELNGINGSVEAKTSGGGIYLSEIDGRVYARTSGGRIKSSRVTGDATLQTSGGPITVEEHNGHLDTRTSGGGITINGLRGSANARTSGGPIAASLVEPPASDCELRTSGGGIKISLPRGTNAFISARTSGGSVVTDLPVEVVGKVKRSSLEGKLGSGGPNVVLKTSGGGIRIEASD